MGRQGEGGPGGVGDICGTALNTATSSGTTSTSLASSFRDIDVPVPSSLKNVTLPELPRPNLPSLTAEIESRAERYMAPFYDLMSEYYGAICAGAMLGTAVTVGMLVGAVAAGGVLYGASGILSLPAYWVRMLVRRSGFGGSLRGGVIIPPPPPDPPTVDRSADETGKRVESICNNGGQDGTMVAPVTGFTSSRGLKGQSSGEQEGSRRISNSSRSGGCGDAARGECEVAHLVLEGGSDGDVKNIPLISIFRGDVRMVSLSSIDQCRECLDGVGALLGKHSLGWSNVRKMTVYIVSGRCDPSEFRAVRDEYPFPRNEAITTIVLVQGLEQDGAVVQVEVITSNQ